MSWLDNFFQGEPGAEGPQGPAGTPTVTWANDLVHSTATHQYVSGITGYLGVVTLGDGSTALNFQQANNGVSASPSALSITAAPGWGTAAGADLDLTAGVGGTSGIIASGGDVNISSGTPFTGNNAGGDINLYTGYPSGSGAFGKVTIQTTSGSTPAWSFDTGTQVIFMANSVTPVSNPTRGGYLYVDNGALYWRGSSGTVTKIANA